MPHPCQTETDHTLGFGGSGKGCSIADGCCESTTVVWPQRAWLTHPAPPLAHEVTSGTSQLLSYPCLPSTLVVAKVLFSCNMYWRHRALWFLRVTVIAPNISSGDVTWPPVLMRLKAAAPLYLSPRVFISCSFPKATCVRSTVAHRAIPSGACATKVRGLHASSFPLK